MHKRNISVEIDLEGCWPSGQSYFWRKVSEIPQEWMEHEPWVHPNRNWWYKQMINLPFSNFIISLIYHDLFAACWTFFSFATKGIINKGGFKWLVSWPLQLKTNLQEGCACHFLLRGPQYKPVLYLKVYHFVNTIGYV